VVEIFSVDWFSIPMTFVVC